MFFIKYYKIKSWIILLLCLFLGILNVFSQIIKEGKGISFIKNYPLSIYENKNHKYAIAQSSKGIIFVSDFNDIVGFDGSTWRHIKINGTPKIVSSKNGDIYVCGYEEIGKLIYTNGKIQYNVIINKIIENGLIDAPVKSIGVCNEEFLFTTHNALFSLRSGHIEKIDTCSLGFEFFDLDTLTFVLKQGEGLFTYEDKCLVPTKTIYDFSGKQIDNVSSFNEGLLIKFKGSSELWYSENNKLKNFNEKVGKFISRNGLVDFKVLNNSILVLATKNSGIAFIDTMGTTFCVVDEDVGLASNRCIDIMLSKENNVWVLHENGVSIIETNEIFSLFPERLGVRGVVSSFIRFQGTLYSGTSEKLLYLNKECVNVEYPGTFTRSGFNKVIGINRGCLDLLIRNQRLIAISKDGIYFVEGTIARKAYDCDVIMAIPSQNDSTILIVSCSDGVRILQVDKHIRKIGQITGIDQKVISLAEDNQGYLWQVTPYHGLYGVDLKKGYTGKMPAEFIKIEGDVSPVFSDEMKIYSSHNGLIFSFSNGLFRFNERKATFYRDVILENALSHLEQQYFFIKKSKNDGLWISAIDHSCQDNILFYIEYDEDTDSYIKIKNPYRMTSDYAITDIYEDDSIIWFGGLNYIIRYNKKKLSNLHTGLPILLRNITIDNDSVLVWDNNMIQWLNDSLIIIDSLIPRIDYKYNTIKLEFSFPSFSGLGGHLYQYKLRGINKDWSYWQTENYKEFENLREGYYTFYVRAMDRYGNISSEAVFAFRISPPLYRTWYAYIIYLILLTSFIIMLINWRAYLFAQEKYKLESTIAERTEELIKQKERAEELVANILPRDTAQELQVKGKATRKKYKMVTVLFSDVQGFTKIAEHMNPEQLLDELDKYFYYFDTVVEILDIEKIKTIGDAYMCAGGIPSKNRTNPIDVVLAAIKMRQYMQELKKQSKYDWDVRLGIHTGPVIAGVVGSKKFSYDIWGDTVNIASRMESSGKVGEINISETTYELVQEYFECIPRGRVPVKYKGDLKMYYVKGLKPVYSVDKENLVPNKDFYVKLQMVRFDDLEESIMQKLEKGLSKNLYYHNIKHTIDVCVEVEVIGKGEGVSDEELLLLKTAALLHDIGFLIEYDDHELHGIKIAKEILPQFFYTEEQINKISELIYSTKWPPNPRNKLEEIMCDADLSYLGRTDFIPVSQNLFRELFERGKIRTLDEWNKLQYDFMKEHHYYTQTTRNIRGLNKEQQLEMLRKMIS